MRAMFAGFGLLAMLGACQPLPQQGMAPSPPTAQEAEKHGTGLPDEPEFKAMPPTDVRNMKCSTLNSASDDDKAYASTFLLGYRSALMHMHVLDTKQIDSIVQAAVGECAAKPEASAYNVFSVAQFKAAQAEHPSMRAPRRRMIPVAAPAVAPVQPSLPPVQYAPSPATPMEQSAAPKPPEAKAAAAPEKPAIPAPAPETAPAATIPADSAKPSEPEPAKPAAAVATPAPATSAPATPAPAAAPEPKPADTPATPSTPGSRQ